METLTNLMHPIVEKWSDKNSKNKGNNGFLDWASSDRLWGGHSGSYAKYIKNHPECDPSRPTYRLRKDECL